LIKLKAILLEKLSKDEITDIVERVYPKIVSKLGKGKRRIPKVSVHSSIYARLSGVEGMMGTANPHAEYDWDTNEIFLYSPRMTNEEEVIRALIHEYTHSKQDYDTMLKYRNKGYANNPYEKAATKAEKTWKRYI
jgi:hypothetical protein